MRVVFDEYVLYVNLEAKWPYIFIEGASSIGLKKDGGDVFVLFLGSLNLCLDVIMDVS